MKIIISTDGDQIKPLNNDGEAIKKVNKTFNNLVLDLPSVPFNGMKMSLAKDGLLLEGTVDWVFLNYYAKGNKLFKNDEEERLEYFVRLKDMELTDFVDDFNIHE